MTIRLGWGWKIAALYTSFATMILVLVIASSKQKFDLVATDYYKDEITYQHVLDASKNQSGLSGSLVIRANEQMVTVDYPGEFSDKPLQGTISFYSAVNKEWDRTFPIKVINNGMRIERKLLLPTNYKMKIAYTVEGKSYYQENDVNLQR